MCTELKIRAFNAVLPPEFIRQTEINEKAMMAAKTFIMNLIKQTSQYVVNKQPKELDAFPADRLCQGRVINLPELFENPEICNELTDLAVKIDAKEPIALLEVSKNVHYLMDCRILTITKAIKEILPNGIRMSKTEHRQLTSLSPDLSGQVCDKITQHACSRISKETIERLQEYGRRMQVSNLHQRMLDYTVVFNLPNYLPKTFGCGFFTAHLALLCSLQKKTPVAIRTIVPEGLSHLLCFRAHETDFEFQEPVQLEKTGYVAVFQAVVPSQDALLAKIKEIGLIELILRFSAQDTPYEHTSTLDSVKDPEGRAMLEEYRRKAAESGCDEKLFRIHHMYVNTFQEEVK